MEITIPTTDVRKLLLLSGRLKGGKLLPDGLYFYPNTGRGLSVFKETPHEAFLFECPDAVCYGNDAFFVETSLLKAVMGNVRGQNLSFSVSEKKVDVKFQEDLWSATVTVERKSQALPAWRERFAEWALQPAEDFLSNYKFALPFISKDEVRPAIRGVGFMKDGSVAATDGRRLVFRDNGHSLSLPQVTVEKQEPTGFMMPKNIIHTPAGADLVIPDKPFLRMADSVSGVQVFPDGSVFQVRLAGDNWKYVLRCETVTYPNYRQVIPQMTPIVCFDFGEGALNAFKAVDSMFKDNCVCVRMKQLATKAKLFLKADKPSTGRTISIDMERCGEANVTFETGVSASFMVQALEHGFRKFEQEAPMCPLVSSNGPWKHVLMPARF